MCYYSGGHETYHNIKNKENVQKEYNFQSLSNYKIRENKGNHLDNKANSQNIYTGRSFDTRNISFENNGYSVIDHLKEKVLK